MRNVSHVIPVPISDADILQIFHKKSFSRSSCPEEFCKKGGFRNFAGKLTGKHLCLSLIFNNVPSLRTANLLKKRLWHKCFTANSKNTSGGCFHVSSSIFGFYPPIVKDTDRAKPSNKTQMLTKSMNLNIWLVSRLNLNQLFIRVVISK